MLANTLVTNEIKDRAGAEQEFGRISQGERQTEFAYSGETPSLPHRLTIKHSETGVGTEKRRRSVVRFDKAVTGQVDTTVTSTISAYTVLDLPIGNLTGFDQAKDVVANLNSFMASLGATTTILFDGTGNGSVTLLTGSL